MSAMRLRTPVCRIAVQQQQSSIGARRFFQSSRCALKETEAGDAERAQRVEKEKQQQMKEGRSEWKDDSLSSESESVIKADRGETKDAKADINELQKETAKASEREKGKK